MKSINWLELRALRLMLEKVTLEDGSCRAGVGGARRARFWADKKSVAYIVHSMVTVSEELMPELRELARVFREKNIELDVKLIPSAFNVWADRLWRTDPSDVQCSRARWWP